MKATTSIGEDGEFRQIKESELFLSWGKVRQYLNSEQGGL